jgi:hypothetical protein
MEREFCSYEQALALKELGFNEECLEDRKLCSNREQPGGCQLHNLHCSYPNCTIDKTIEPIPLPLKQQVFRWFREEYNLKSCIMFRHNMEDDKEYYDWLIKGQEVIYRHFTTYEEAENACIDKLIELAKEQKKIDMIAEISGW